MQYSTPAFEQKIVSPEALMAHLSVLPKPWVMTNGCFDILHRGHVTYLAQARTLGNSLIVALNTDESVRRLGKGVERPINMLLDRAAVLASLESVSLVTWFTEDTPEQLVSIIQPDCLVKGGDWPIEQIVGAKATLARGGSVHSIPFIFDVSTTKTLEKVRAGTEHK